MLIGNGSERNSFGSKRGVIMQMNELTRVSNGCRGHNSLRPGSTLQAAPGRNELWPLHLFSPNIITK